MRARTIGELLDEIMSQDLIPVYGHIYCPSCDGTGYAHNDPCPVCAGIGQLFVEDSEDRKSKRKHRPRHCRSVACDYIDEHGFCGCGCTDCRAADENMSERKENESE